MLEIIQIQGFCQLKIKITQFPNGFRLNALHVENIARVKSLSFLDWLCLTSFPWSLAP